MKIIIDYDNDAIRFGRDKDIDRVNEANIITFRQVKNLSKFEIILNEIINSLFAEKPIGINIGLYRQDDGKIITIEEY